MRHYLLCTMLSIGLSASALADDHKSTEDKIKSALAADVRTAAELERDRNRRPLDTLNFFGLQDNMTVVELVPGSGWYTKILAPVVKEKGQYFAAIGTRRIKENLAGTSGFEDIKITGEDAKIWREDGAQFLSLTLDSLGVKNADIVFTFRNYHNFDDAARATMNTLAFDALKAGGIYAVVDHTARHMEPMRSSNRRRFDPVKAIKEIQAAGFELVDYSNVHYREDDELRFEVGAKSVTGNTDRFTLKFRKP